MAEGTKDDPWELTTAPGTSKYSMYRDGDELVCVVGSTTLKYHAPRDRRPHRVAQGAGRLGAGRRRR